MLTIPGLKVQQFNQEFFLLNLSAEDVERLVRFEVRVLDPRSHLMRDVRLSRYQLEEK